MTSKTYHSSYLTAIKLVTFAGSLQACGIATHAGDGIVVSGSPTGIQAFSDMLAGTAQNAKASPDAATTPYYDLRKEQTRASVLRYNQPRAGGK